MARIFRVSGRIFARMLRERGLGHITPEQGRVLVGTNYPMITARKCLAELDSLGLDEETKDLFLHGNARRIFRL